MGRIIGRSEHNRRGSSGRLLSRTRTGEREDAILSDALEDEFRRNALFCGSIALAGEVVEACGATDVEVPRVARRSSSLRGHYVVSHERWSEKVKRQARGDFRMSSVRGATIPREGGQMQCC